MNVEFMNVFLSMPTTFLRVQMITIKTNCIIFSILSYMTYNNRHGHKESKQYLKEVTFVQLKIVFYLHQMFFYLKAYPFFEV